MIHESLLEWEKTTKELIQLLNLNDEKLRDNVIGQVEQLLNKREMLQSAIQPPFSKEENDFGQNLLMLEKELDTKLKMYLQDIHKDMQQHKKKKISVHAYLNPYNKVFRDGTFYDNKK